MLLVTGFHPKDGTRDIVVSTAKHLGGFKVIDKHEKKLRPTHVVCGEQRTLSLLLGVLHGSWLLTPEWAMVSLEKGVEETCLARKTPNKQANKLTNTKHE